MIYLGITCVMRYYHQLAGEIVRVEFDDWTDCLVMESRAGNIVMKLDGSVVSDSY